MLYLCAAYTGLRSSELGSLTADSLDLQGDTPTVAVAASYSKRRRLDTQPLRPDLAAFFQVWLAGRNAMAADEPLWPGTWMERAAKMLRKDLLAARQAWLKEIPDEAERRKLEKSDFLRDEDRKGQVLDFHSLRHTFISNLAVAGVHPKVAQQLARHSTINLTMDRYTHLATASVAGALTNLPKLPQCEEKKPGTAELNSAGGTKKLTRRLTLSDDFSCQPLASPGRKGRAASKKSETPKSASCGNLGVETRPLSAHEKNSGGGIRTPDTRIMIPDVDDCNEHGSKRLENSTTAAYTPAYTEILNAEWEGLQRVARCWPLLPEHVRQTVLFLIDSAVPSEQNGGPS